MSPSDFSSNVFSPNYYPESERRASLNSTETRTIRANGGSCSSSVVASTNEESHGNGESGNMEDEGEKEITGWDFDTNIPSPSIEEQDAMLKIVQDHFDGDNCSKTDTVLAADDEVANEVTVETDVAPPYSPVSSCSSPQLGQSREFRDRSLTYPGERPTTKTEETKEAILLAKAKLEKRVGE
jgi:hypothetical protein